MLCSNSIIEDFARSIAHFDCPMPFDSAGFFYVSSEQVPNSASRVRVGDEVDRFGLRRTVLDWQVLPIDKKTVRETVLTFAKSFAKAEIGRV
jgi:hypothetical protein